MDKKDLLGIEINKIMEEEVGELFLSEEIKANILKKAPSFRIKTIREFLNKEIELPLIPIGAGLLAVFLLLIVPIDGIIRGDRVKTLDFGSSQVIIRDFKEVSKRWR